MPAASGSSRTRAGGRATGCCRWRSPDSPRSAIAVRSPPTASRATARGSRCRCPRDLVELLAPAAVPRPAIVQLFLPRGRVRGTRSRLVEAALSTRSGLSVDRWRASRSTRPPLGARRGPRCPASSRRSCCGRRTARARPPSSGGSSSPGVASRPRARRGLLDELAVPSASSRTIVYKGLVAGDRLAQLFPDLAAPLDVPYALFHQRYATNTPPVWRLAQPFRSIAHNGEINTVRGNREQVRGRARDAGATAAPAELLAAGPALSPDGSDSLSLDESLELLTMTGWDLPTALLASIPEALALRLTPIPRSRRSSAARPASSRRGTDRRRSCSATGGGSARCSTATGCGRRRFADPGRDSSRSRPRPAPSRSPRPRPSAADASGRARCCSSIRAAARSSRTPRRRPPSWRRCRSTTSRTRRTRTGREVPATHPPSMPQLRYLAGLDAERGRLDIKTMALESHEPLWSMGDDTPTPGRGRLDRRAVDHLRQAFAQVTNPPIDPERERVVMDLRVELGRRPALLGGLPPVRGRSGSTGRSSPTSTGCSTRFPGPIVRLDATWDPAAGRRGPRRRARPASRPRRSAPPPARYELLVLSDRAFDFERLPVPSVLAVGAVHTALTDAGLRGRADIVVEAADVLDVHAFAMALAAGGAPRSTRGSRSSWPPSWRARAAPRTLTPDAAPSPTCSPRFEAGLRKTLARMGISAISSYVGGRLFDTSSSTHPSSRAVSRAAAWPGRVDPRRPGPPAARSPRRRRGAAEPAPGREARLPDPGFARFRADGEAHLYAPKVVGAVQELLADEPPASQRTTRRRLTRYRAASAALDAAVRSATTFRVRPRAPALLDEVESARSIARRFVVSAMSVGALSPEAHQALTIGIQRAGGAANTGEGGEDPAWYAARPERRAPRRADQAGRVGPVRRDRRVPRPRRPARDQDRPGLEARRGRPAAGPQGDGVHRRAPPRASPASRCISPPPHHDIYSIEDLAQLIADLRAINPGARIGVKLVASRGVGTIAAGVVKAGAAYVHLSGHAGGTGASPLQLDQARRRAVGARPRRGPPGPAPERPARPRRAAHRRRAPDRPRPADRRAPRRGGVRVRDRDARRRRLRHGPPVPPRHVSDRDRHPARGPPREVRRLARRRSSGSRSRSPRTSGASSRRSARDPSARSSARPGAAPRRSGGARTTSVRSSPAPSWTACPGGARDRPTRRGGRARPGVGARGAARRALHGQGSRASRPAADDGRPIVRAALSGAIERGELRGPVRSSCAARPASRSARSRPPASSSDSSARRTTTSARGCRAGRSSSSPSRSWGSPRPAAVAGNTCLYGATGRRVHLVGRAGMRFAVRNSGAQAVVEGIGAHGCEYMTGGVVVVLGPVGANFGAGMTGGRAYLYDPSGRHAAALHTASVRAVRLAESLADREDGPGAGAGIPGARRGPPRRRLRAGSAAARGGRPRECGLARRADRRPPPVAATPRETQPPSTHAPVSAAVPSLGRRQLRLARSSPRPARRFRLRRGVSAPTPRPPQCDTALCSTRPTANAAGLAVSRWARRAGQAASGSRS